MTLTWVQLNAGILVIDSLTEKFTEKINNAGLGDQKCEQEIKQSMTGRLHIFVPVTHIPKKQKNKKNPEPKHHEGGFLCVPRNPASLWFPPSLCLSFLIVAQINSVRLRHRPLR